jgi:hypothetical protein
MHVPAGKLLVATVSSRLVLGNRAVGLAKLSAMRLAKAHGASP